MWGSSYTHIKISIRYAALPYKDPFSSSFGATGVLLQKSARSVKASIGMLNENRTLLKRKTKYKYRDLY